MNDQGMLLLSYALEVLALFSMAIAVIVVWEHLRAKRAERLKDAKSPSSRLRGVMDAKNRE